MNPESLTRDDVLSAAATTARAVVRAGGTKEAMATMQAVVEKLDDTAWGTEARAVAEAILAELGDALPPHPDAGVWVTIVVGWRGSKPPEKKPMWFSSFGSQLTKAIRYFEKTWSIKTDVFRAAMEDASASAELRKLIDEGIGTRGAKAGVVGWLVEANVFAWKGGGAAPTEKNRGEPVMRCDYWTGSVTGYGPSKGWVYGYTALGKKRYLSLLA